MAERSLVKDSLPRNIEWRSENNHLLVIGIDDYVSPIPKLFNAKNDALAFKKVLVNQYSFSEKDCISLLNQEATKKKIYHAFDTLLRKVKKGDNVVIYFSGHGVYFSPTKRGYWIPADGQSKDRTTFLSNSDVLDVIKNLKAKHVFCAVDSCFSSALFRKVEETDNRTLRIYNQASRWLLTSGRLEPVSDGQLGTNSPFTQSLVSHLTYNKDILWVGDLCRAVIKGTIANSDHQIPRGEPIQNVGHQGGEFLFIPKGLKLTDDQYKDLEPSFLQPAKSTKSNLLYRTFGMIGLIVLISSSFLIPYYLKKGPSKVNQESKGGLQPTPTNDTTELNQKPIDVKDEVTVDEPKEVKSTTSPVEAEKTIRERSPISVIGEPSVLSQDSAYSDTKPTLAFAKIKEVWKEERHHLAEKGVKSACAFRIDLQIQATDDVTIKKVEVDVKDYNPNIEGYEADAFRTDSGIPVIFVPIRNKRGKNSDWFYIVDGEILYNYLRPIRYPKSQKNDQMVIRIEPFEAGIYSFDCYIEYTYRGEVYRLAVLKNQTWLFDY